MFLTPIVSTGTWGQVEIPGVTARTRTAEGLRGSELVGELARCGQHSCLPGSQNIRVSISTHVFMQQVFIVSCILGGKTSFGSQFCGEESLESQRIRARALPSK